MFFNYIYNFKNNILFLVFITTNTIFSQSLNISTKDSTILNTLKIDIKKIYLNYEKHTNKSIWWKSTQEELYKKGFLNASFDSLENGNWLYLGKLNKNIKLNASTLPIYGNKFSKIKSFENFEKSNMYSQSILNLYKKNGFLYAKYNYQNCKDSPLYIQCDIAIDTGIRKTIQQIYLDAGSSLVSLPFASKYLKLKAGKYFSIDEVKKIERKVQGSEFYELDKPLEFLFTDTTANIIATIKHRKSNKFFAFLGLLPNAYNSDQMQLTADIQLGLANMFGRGIGLDVNWQKPQNSNQFLNISNTIPMILGTPFGSIAKFKLEKFDTSYLRIYLEGGIEYFQDLNTRVQFYYSYQSSKTITFDTSFLISKKLPSNLDYSHHKIGIRYKYQNTDEFLLPKEGWRIDGAFEFGRKIINIDKRISNKYLDTQFTYQKLYDSIGIENSVLYLQAQIDKYSKLSNVVSLRSRLISSIIYTKSILKNEQLTFGGNRLPRGFDDHFFLAPFYLVFSNEIQYFLNRKMMLALAYDYSIATIQNSNKSEIIHPRGVALGLNWVNNLSYFNFWFALGNNTSSFLGYNQSKVHFGYVAMF